MRVAYLLARAPFAAQEQFVLLEAAALAAQGVDVRLYPLRPGRRLVPGCPPGLAARTHGGGAWSAPTLASTSAQLVRAPGLAAHVARSLTAWQDDEPRLAPLARNAYVVPKVISLMPVLRGFQPDHIHAHFGASSSTAAMILAERLGVPWSFTAHSPTDISKRNLLRAKARSAAFVRVISSDGSARLRAAIGDELASRIVMIPMGIAAAGTAPDVPDPRFARPDPAEVSIVSVARLIEAKGEHHLIEAVASLKRTGVRLRCHLVGDGPERERLSRLADELGVRDVVHFHGYVANEEVLGALDSGSFDLAVLPSYSEGIPVTLMEAMARDLPIVATAVGGVGELVTPSTGELVAPRDTPALTAALARAAERITPGAARGGGRSVIAERHCLSRNTEFLRGLFAISADPSDGLPKQP